MIQSFDRGLRMGMTCAGEVADEFLLLVSMLITGSPAAKYSALSWAMFSNWALRSGWAPMDFFLRALRWPRPCFRNSLRTVRRLAGVPISRNRRLISQRDRLVHNTPSRIGSPAVNSASSARKLTNSWGCCSIAGFRPPPFFSDPLRCWVIGQV